jgi:hypothetical protein
VGATWDNHPLGVAYLQDGHWTIYHRDDMPMSPTATYNVQIGSGGASGGRLDAVECDSPCLIPSLDLEYYDTNNTLQHFDNTSQYNWVFFAMQANWYYEIVHSYPNGFAGKAKPDNTGMG